MTEADLKEMVDAKNKVENATEAEEKKKATDQEEIQMAAGYYAKLSKTIRGYSGNMKAGGLGRVMVALAEFPYGESYPKFRSEAEQQLFTFMLTIQSAKAKIAAALQLDQAQVENEAIDGIVKEEMDKINNKGEADGSKVD